MLFSFPSLLFLGVKNYEGNTKKQKTNKKKEKSDHLFLKKAFIVLWPASGFILLTTISKKGFLPLE